MNKVDLGKKIREARLKKGYTQKVLAEKANIGFVYLSEIERGAKMPSLNIFIKIVEALEVSADYLLRNELSSGKEYVYSEIIEELNKLTPYERNFFEVILKSISTCRTNK